MSVTLTALLAAVVLLVLYNVQRSKSRERARLPPGPRPLPIFGNILDLPSHKPWVKYLEWSKEYNSELIYLDLPNQPTIILNSGEAILSLMEGPSGNYSDKPVMAIEELTGWEWNVGLLPYGPRWRLARRLFHQHFNQHAVKRYNPIQIREVRALLKRTANNKANEGRFDMISVRQTLVAIILDITYGMRIENLDNEFVSLAQTAAEALSRRFPGSFWAEFFPWLKYIPSWIPGSSARAWGDHYSPIAKAARSKPFDAVMIDVQNGTATPSVSRSLAENLGKLAGSSSYNEFETGAKDATGTAYVAAVDTQFAVMSTFLLAMLAAPHVQRKAQAELDSVVGTDRLPTVEDLPSLPFVQAIYLEAMRWMPVLPLGVPRRAIADDEYKGYHIPAGTIIMMNIWAMLYDPDEYSNPDVFDPDRFMRDGKINPDIRDSTANFGFGRRKCAGRHLARETLLLMISSILYAFNIEPMGQEISAEPSTGFVS
ncbi:hypothetical protein NM688_g5535 [Phlebia brevispora]|uniref:Uncharacterized protein n=1 Tax=Phlebia brevispora TaxID=194682 RepID=A0ACC1STT5_9APHY|nr:hypothetical protein NM688_g5535 [Phlebia brevispora]